MRRRNTNTKLSKMRKEANIVNVFLLMCFFGSGFRYLLCEGYRELVAKGCCIHIFVISSEPGLLILVHVLEHLADHTAVCKPFQFLIEVLALLAIPNLLVAANTTTFSLH